MASVTDQQIASFIEANLDNPQAILDAMSQYGVTYDDISRATGYTSTQIQNYFAPYQTSTTSTQTTQPTSFNDWLSDSGYRLYEGDDQSYIFTPDGQRISANVNDPGFAALQNEYQISQQYANPDVWGTEGSYYGGLTNVGSSDSGQDIGGFGTPAGPEGYVRTGTEDNSRFDAFGGGYYYDPTYGWIVPESVASAYGDANDDSLQYFLAAAALAAAPVAASITGAGAVAGAEGGNIIMVDGVPIDISGYLTNVDNVVAGAAGGAAGASTGDFAYNPGVFDENSPFIFDGESWYMPDGVTPLTADGIASTVGTLSNGTFTPGTANPSNPTSPTLPPGATTPATTLPGGTTPGTTTPGTTPGGSTPTIPGVPTDWGSLLASLLGAYGNNEMADAYRDIQGQYIGIGEPFRDLLLGSYQPGFSMQNEPGYADALKSSTDQFLRAASAGNAPGVGAGGNPFDNPNAWAETMKYVTSNTALPALYSYRGGLTSAGSFGLPQSIQPAMMAPMAQGQAYSNLGYGLSSLFPNQQQQANYAPPINQPNTFFV